MDSEEAPLKAPNWLNELEAKREKRVKAKLGHETGAGAKCLKCDEKCPGLDLHFWRKTCKNCKCTKEEHDVHDDDIHGWAEWQLLGSKPNKIKTKITLPGRNDAVELDWTPKGNQETVESFLKSQPIENIPVKGSKAAQDRKQLLQKQIPIHDIDPSLCHELTNEEYEEMSKYIAHVKEKSVGVGHLVNIGNIVRGVVHNMAPTHYQMLLDKYGKNIPLFEIVKLQDLQNVSKKLENLNLKVDLPNYTPNILNIINDNQKSINFEKYKDKIYSGQQQNDNANILTPNYVNIPFKNTGNVANQNTPLPDRTHQGHNALLPNYNPQNQNTTMSDLQNPQNLHNTILPGLQGNPMLPNYDPQNQNTRLPSVQNPQNVNFRDFNATLQGYTPQTQNTMLPDRNPQSQNATLPSYDPQNRNTLLPSEKNPQNVNFKDFNATLMPQSVNTLLSDVHNPENVNFGGYNAALPSYTHQNQNTQLSSVQNPENVNFGGINQGRNAALPNYNPQNPNAMLPSVQNPQNVNFRDFNATLQGQNNQNTMLSGQQNPENVINARLPSYMPQNQGTMLSDRQNPQNVNFKDVNRATLPGYDPQSQNTGLSSVQNPLNVNYKNLNPTMQDSRNATLPSRTAGLPDYQATLPSEQNLADKGKIGNLRDLAYSTYDNQDEYSPNHNTKVLGSKFNALEGIKPQEDYLYPENVQIGGILDVKMAVVGENENYIDIPLPTEGEKIIIDNVVLPCCHYCRELFDLNEFAVAIERSNCLFHASCFKCAGCNQILADNMYFYHKESNNIYCLRDYAKIKGYPRCKGCDELIFTKEYCLTEENTFHLKHFCCINCDIPLAGQNYLLENDHPICLPCYEKNNADKCQGCQNIIKPHEEGLKLKDKHFHVKDECFCCFKCKKPLLNKKLLFRNDKLFCSHECFQNV